MQHAQDIRGVAEAGVGRDRLSPGAEAEQGRYQHRRRRVEQQCRFERGIVGQTGDQRPDGIVDRPVHKTGQGVREAGEDVRAGRAEVRRARDPPEAVAKQQRQHVFRAGVTGELVEGIAANDQAAGEAVDVREGRVGRNHIIQSHSCAPFVAPVGHMLTALFRGGLAFLVPSHMVP